MPLKGTGPLFDGIHDFSLTYRSIYFVLTATCVNGQLESPCSLADLGSQCVKSENNIFAYPGSIGGRIAATLKLSNFTSVDLDVLTQNFGEENELRKTCLPVANIYLYCSPCACLVSAALSICSLIGNRSKTFFKFSIRPDDRLVSSCCLNEDRSLGLGSLVQMIKGKEARHGFLPTPIYLLDRQWMEQRLFEIEETEDVQSFQDSATLAKQLFASHRSERTTAGIVVFGELEYSLPIMQSAPFVPKPRIPRETEIFQMRSDYENGKRVWNRTYLGTYTPKLIQGMSIGTTIRPISSLASITSVQSTLPTPRQTSPPPSPATKRQKTSPAPSVTTEDFHQETRKAPVLEVIGTSN
jgi:hypothetical protein